MLNTQYYLYSMFFEESNWKVVVLIISLKPPTHFWNGKNLIKLLLGILWCLSGFAIYPKLLNVLNWNIIIALWIYTVRNIIHIWTNCYTLIPSPQQITPWHHYCPFSLSLKTLLIYFVCGFYFSTGSQLKCKIAHNFHFYCLQ